MSATAADVPAHRPRARAVRTVAVVGAGAIGSAVVAVLVAETAHEVTVCLRQPIDGIELRRPDGTVVRAEPRCALDPAECSPVELVLLATKAYQSAGAAPWLDALVGAGTVVAVLQNGIDQVTRIQPLAPTAEIVPVAVLLAAERVAPGRVVQSGVGVLDVPATVGGRLVAEVFEGSSIRVDVAEDFTTRAWRKLLINAVVGAIGALTIRDLGVLAEPAIGEVALALAEEVVAVGRAEGADFGPDAAARALDRALRGAPGHWSSIAADRREGRPLEWEVRNAVIGRLGRRHGIATPRNDLVTALLQACDRP